MGSFRGNKIYGNVFFVQMFFVKRTFSASLSLASTVAAACLSVLKGLIYGRVKGLINTSIHCLLQGMYMCVKI